MRSSSPVSSRLALPCLVSLMANLGDKIRDLEAKIEGYEQEYANAAPDSEEKKLLLAIITAKETRLTALYQQQGE